MVEPSRTAMTKADLIGVVAKRLDITQVQAGIIVASVDATATTIIRRTAAR